MNVTLGLPFIRTTVDHGTAFDLAGKATASAQSPCAAYDLARAFAAHAREDHVTRFVFMLTHDDATVPGAAEVARQLAPLNIPVVGFKDVGLLPERLAEVVEILREQGREIALEVVNPDPDAELRAIEAGLELGVDLLLGGTRVPAALALIGDADVRYCPFPGTIGAHPSGLAGTHEEIIAHAVELAALDSVWGLDLLALPVRGRRRRRADARHDRRRLQAGDRRPQRRRRRPDREDRRRRSLGLHGRQRRVRGPVRPGRRAARRVHAGIEATEADPEGGSTVSADENLEQYGYQNSWAGA